MPAQRAMGQIEMPGEPFDVTRLARGFMPQAMIDGHRDQSRPALQGTAPARREPHQGDGIRSAGNGEHDRGRSLPVGEQKFRLARRDRGMVVLCHGPTIAFSGEACPALDGVQPNERASALHPLLLAVDGGLHAGRGARIFPRHFAERGAGRQQARPALPQRSVALQRHLQGHVRAPHARVALRPGLHDLRRDLPEEVPLRPALPRLAAARLGAAEAAEGGALSQEVGHARGPRGRARDRRGRASGVGGAHERVRPRRPRSRLPPRREPLRPLLRRREGAAESRASHRSRPPPYYGLVVYAGDLGTKGGLKTDASARVLKDDGAAIPGPLRDRQLLRVGDGPHVSRRRRHDGARDDVRLHPRLREIGN